jgi:hypothetical protein
MIVSAATVLSVARLLEVFVREQIPLACLLEHSQEESFGDVPIEQALADVLGQLGKTKDHSCNNFPEESYSAITKLVQSETEPQPLAAGVAALGHLDNPLAVLLITSFSSHPGPEVRLDVAFALGYFPNESLSIETPLRLTQDTDKDVRDWATFGLGVRAIPIPTKFARFWSGDLATLMRKCPKRRWSGWEREKTSEYSRPSLTALERPNTTFRAIETAYQMLGIDNEREDWKGTDYATALRQRFSV